MDKGRALRAAVPVRPSASLPRLPLPVLGPLLQPPEPQAPSSCTSPFLSSRRSTATAPLEDTSSCSPKPPHPAGLSSRTTCFLVGSHPRVGVLPRDATSRESSLPCPVVCPFVGRSSWRPGSPLGQSVSAQSDS